jgi:integrase
MARRAVQGTGTIRKKTVTRAGKEYTYWEARYTAGVDSGTGKQIQRSITGKTQKEVAQELKATTASIDAGTYIAPNKQTVRQWLDAWITTHSGGIKPRTLDIYKSDIRLHIKPALGAMRLEVLTTQMTRRSITI